MNQSDSIHLLEILALLRRNAKRTVLIMLSCGVAGLALSFVVPKKFNSKTVLNIQPAYFQTPLVSDLVAAAGDSVETRAQRESLLRLALNNDFLDKLGNQFRIFKYDAADPMHAVERAAFLKEIQYYSVGPNSYEISVNGKTAEAAYEMSRMILDQMISTFIEERANRLNLAKNAILKNIETLRSEGRPADVAPPGGKSGSSDSLKIAEEELRILESRFTERHPKVVEQRSRVRMLRANGGSLLGGSGDRLSGSQRSAQDLYDDLVKKSNYLNIVIDMERTAAQYPYLTVLEQPTLPAAPVFPKKRIFAGIGLGVGLVASILFLLLSEFKRGTFTSPENATRWFDAPFLGTLPPWRPESSIKMLPDLPWESERK